MRKFVKCTRGATSIEYGLFGALAAIVLMSGLSTIGERIGGSFSKAGAAMAAGRDTPEGTRIEIRKAENGFLDRHEER
jgi:Flp pilus assembly pilin Flp